MERPLVCNLTGAYTNPTYVYYSKVVAILESQTSPPGYSPGFKLINDGKCWPGCILSIVLLKRGFVRNLLYHRPIVTDG